MGYDPAIVVRDVSRILSRQPGRTLSSIAKDLGVDRHTVTRDLKLVGGVSFRELQAEFMLAALDRLRASGPLLKKEVADLIGLPSTRALRVWTLRLRKASNNVASVPKLSELRRRGRSRSR